MTEHAAFLTGLFSAGRAVVRGRPSPEDATRHLADAYERYRLDVAGPLIPFDSATANAAAHLLHEACWFLVDRSEAAAVLEQSLRMPITPRTATEHLSADLLLRYVSAVHRRARALGARDPLTTLLAELLCQWPLSGVLADLDDAPTGDLDFADHPGLQLLYAERLNRSDKKSWHPTGKSVEYVELVFAERGVGSRARARSEGEADGANDTV